MTFIDALNRTILKQRASCCGDNLLLPVAPAPLLLPLLSPAAIAAKCALTRSLPFSSALAASGFGRGTSSGFGVYPLSPAGASSAPNNLPNNGLRYVGLESLQQTELSVGSGTPASADLES